MNKIKEIRNKIRNLNDYKKNLKYTYLNLINKDRMHFEESEELREKYGIDRDGFERFKNEYDVDIPSSSLRYVKDSNGNIINLVIETSTKNDNNKEIEELVNEAKEYVYNKLDIKDSESFEFYIENHFITFKDFNDNYYINYLNALEELLSSYEEDEDFRNFINKIKA